MTGTPPSRSGPTSRDERRRASAEAIVAAAQELFAERGYERTTIRAVADRAGIDPALVMQHHSSKEGLFTASVRDSVPTDDLAAAPREDLPRQALRHILAVYDDPVTRAPAQALLRSSLTHAAAADVLRDTAAEPQERVAATIGGPDAALRAGLLNAVGLGLTISRYLIENPAVAAATAADLERVLGPALRHLVDPEERSCGSTSGDRPS